MENRNKLLTFVLAFIPGVGQMYLGLFKKGIQLLILFFIIEPVLSFIGLHYFSGILQVVIWCYAFFDTFEIAKKLDNGQVVNDTDYIFAKYTNQENIQAGFSTKNFYENKRFWLVCGWALIIVGIMAILNLTFGTNDLYGLIKSYISSYIVPVMLVVAGIYMLTKKNKTN